jgi:hemoglobin
MQIQSRNAPGPHLYIDEELIAAVVEAFYHRIRADDTLGPIFAAQVDDWPEHIEKLTRFWSSVLLMSGRYKGSPLQNHLAIPNLSAAHFQRWLGLFADTLTDLCTSDQAALFMSRAECIAQRFQMAISQQSGQVPMICPIGRWPKDQMKGSE